MNSWSNLITSNENWPITEQLLLDQPIRMALPKMIRMMLATIVGKWPPHIYLVLEKIISFFVFCTGLVKLVELGEFN